MILLNVRRVKMTCIFQINEEQNLSKKDKDVYQQRVLMFPNRDLIRERFQVVVGADISEAFNSNIEVKWNPHRAHKFVLYLLLIQNTEDPVLQSINLEKQELQNSIPH